MTRLSYLDAFYIDAFQAMMISIWGGTKFSNEIDELCYYASMSCWLDDSYISEYYRRELLYFYLKPELPAVKEDDLLNRIKKMLPFSNNMLKRVIKNLTILYDKNPERIIEGSNNEKIFEILNSLKFNSIMKDAYESLKLTDNLLLFYNIIWNEEKKSRELEIRIILPDKYRIVVDNYGNLSELWLHTPVAKGTEIAHEFCVFTKEKYYRADAMGRQIATMRQITTTDALGNSQVNIDNVMEINNQSGIIPCNLLKLSKGRNDYYNVNKSLYSLVLDQLRINSMTVQIDENMLNNSFSLLFGINLGEQKDIKVGHGRLFTLDQKNQDATPSLEYVSGNPVFNELNELRSTTIKNVYKDYGLPNSFIEGTQAPLSGIAMKQQAIELLEARQDDIQVMQDLESKIINTIIKFLNVDEASPYRNQFNGDYEITTKYQELNFEDDAKLIFELNQTKFNAGLMSPSEFLRSVNISTEIKDDTDAVLYIKKNLELLKTLKENQNDNIGPGETLTRTNTNA